jgi:hypothetical protein
MKWSFFILFALTSCHYAADQLQAENHKAFLNQLKVDSAHTMHEADVLRTALLLTWDKWNQGYDSAYLNNFYDSIFIANETEPQQGDVLCMLSQLDSATTVKLLDSLKKQ